MVVIYLVTGINIRACLIINVADRVVYLVAFSVTLKKLMMI